MVEIYSLTIFLFGLGSQTGFFAIVLCPKVKHNYYLTGYFICYLNTHVIRIYNQRTNVPVKAHLINSIIQSINAFTASFHPLNDLVTIFLI